MAKQITVADQKAIKRAACRHHTNTIRAIVTTIHGEVEELDKYMTRTGHQVTRASQGEYLGRRLRLALDAIDEVKGLLDYSSAATYGVKHDPAADGERAARGDAREAR